MSDTVLPVNIRDLEAQEMKAEETVKVTIKFKKSDHDKLMEKVKESNTNISDYIRPIILDDIYNRTDKMNVMEQICRVYTLCTKIIEDDEIPKKHKTELQKEAKKLCLK